MAADTTLFSIALLRSSVCFCVSPHFGDELLEDEAKSTNTRRLLFWGSDTSELHRRSLVSRIGCLSLNYAMPGGCVHALVL